MFVLFSLSCSSPILLPILLLYKKTHLRIWPEPPHRLPGRSHCLIHAFACFRCFSRFLFGPDLIPVAAIPSTSTKPAGQMVGWKRSKPGTVTEPTGRSASLGPHSAQAPAVSGALASAGVEQCAVGTLGCPSAFGIAQRTVSPRDKHAAWTPPLRLSEAWSRRRYPGKGERLRLAW